MEAVQFQKIAKALSDPRRLEILKILAATDECCCGSIGEKIPVAQPTISHHLKELTNAGLVEPRREGQHSYYHFCPQVMSDYIQELQLMIQGCRCHSSEADVEPTLSSQSTTRRDSSLLG